MKAICVVALVLATALCVLCDPLPSKDYIKQLAGPPSEFSAYRPPNPQVAALSSQSAWIPITLEKVDGQNEWAWKGSFPVDSESKFSLSVFSLQKDDLAIYGQPPNWPMTLFDDKIFNTEGAKGQRVEHDFGVGETKMPVTSFIFPDPVKGEWNFEIHSSVEIKHANNKPAVYVLVGNESPITVTTHLNTYDLQKGQEIGLVARVFDVPEGVTNPILEGIPHLRGAIIEAQLDVIFPDGKDIVITMKDDGLSGDLEANDDVFGGVLEAGEVGEYIAYSTIRGRTPSGVEFLRNNVHTFQVVAPSVTLTGLGSAVYEEDRDNVLAFHIDVDTLLPNYDGLLRSYAEVWGTDAKGLDYIPVAWVQAMTPVLEDTDGKQVIVLELNKNWIQMAKAQAPFQLRNVEIDDSNTNMPLSTRSAIFIEMAAEHIANLMSEIDYSVPVVVTEEMEMGPRPAELRRNKYNTLPTDNDEESFELLHLQRSMETPERKMLLVHGYCAGSNEFPTSEFDNSVLFDDLFQSRSNQEFALKLQTFANQYPEGVSIVAHSQGGLASTHLHSYFWSPLEIAPTDGGRIIQSVGSPYQGTTLAGILADIGWVFGIGCGSNSDLTRDGGANWISKLPLKARNDVYYYTTQYDDYWWLLPNDCVTAANVVLSKPNDGTTEVAYGQLPGAHEAGNKRAWCHTGGMKYPAQCTDSQRNFDMNKFAAHH